jgi:hypothetical protein
MNDRPISRPTRHPHPIAGDRSHALRRPDRGAERGTALILSLLFTIIAMGIVFSGSLIMQANQQRTETSFRLNAQATQFARAGITDTLSWFRRQTSQPVTDFEPILDTLSVPPIFDTADPDVGIVREFLIGGSIWGRYEIWKEWGADPEPARLLRRQQQQVVDISASRGQPPGNAWRLRATGSIYRRFDDMVPLDQSPNVRLAVRSLETEIKRLRLAPPGQAAVCIRDGGSATVGLNGRVIGGAAAGISYSDEPTMTAPSAATLSRVTGSPRESTLPGYDDSPEAVFGLPYADLVSIAGRPDHEPGRLPESAADEQRARREHALDHVRRLAAAHGDRRRLRAGQRDDRRRIVERVQRTLVRRRRRRHEGAVRDQRRTGRDGNARHERRGRLRDDPVRRRGLERAARRDRQLPPVGRDPAARSDPRAQLIAGRALGR